MNNQLIDSIIQIVHSLSPEEQIVVREKLFIDTNYPHSTEITNLALHSGSFDFLDNEPDLYSIEDGEDAICP
ncbi:hypothetical protein IQ225_15840 [Synechocystis salina LEGE 06155]|nr:hypothetical protein [Synechocystis salina LEGE 06155]